MRVDATTRASNDRARVSVQIDRLLASLGPDYAPFEKAYIWFCLLREAGLPLVPPN